MSEKPDLKVVELYKHNFRDPSSALRSLADEIERGDYGDVSTCAVSIFGDKLHVFGSGKDSESPTVALLLHAGFSKLSRTLEDYGNES